jgi:hypothetical protein
MGLGLEENNMVIFSRISSTHTASFAGQLRVVVEECENSAGANTGQMKTKRMWAHLPET